MNERSHFNELIVMQLFLKKEILMNILNQFMKDMKERNHSNVMIVMQVFLKKAF